MSDASKTPSTTVLKLSEDKLTAEREHLAVAFHLINDGLIITNAEGEVISINKVAETLTGWNEKESIGKPLGEIFNVINKNRTRYENPVELALKTGGTSSFPRDISLIAKDGTERIIIGSVAPIYDRDNVIIGAALAFRDVTKERRTEANLMKLHGVGSLSTFVSGIAHDFNNILTPILGNISLAKMHVKPGDVSFERLEIAERASILAGGLAQQLLSFSKGGSPILKPGSISVLLKETADFILSGSNVRCELSIPDNLWIAEINDIQISQAISNLIINADQAMPQGGIVKIYAENIAINSGHDLPLKRGKYIKISISDQGVGIAEEHIQKIFDPHFTTKQGGNGLGLAIVHSIIEDHGGTITVDSQLEVGTTFHVYLPASPEITLMEKRTDRKLFEGEGKALIMDNEEMVVDLISAMLDSLGYKVEAAKDGAEAITLYKEAQGSGQIFDVVILDLTIPGGMGGKETVQKLIEIDPEVKAIITSGYSNHPVMTDYKRYGFSSAIAKPYKIKELSEVLNNAINGNGRRV